MNHATLIKTDLASSRRAERRVAGTKLLKANSSWSVCEDGIVSLNQAAPTTFLSVGFGGEKEQHVCLHVHANKFAQDTHLHVAAGIAQWYSVGLRAG
jgi:hypothetical protein